MEEFSIYDEELERQVAGYYLRDQDDLADFIKQIHPRIRLNEIPIKEWFLYEIDDRGDNRRDILTLMKEYKDTKEKLLINTVEIIKNIKTFCEVNK